MLSLNEATQQIEPHRINALLDMGTKTVYKLTTASGRSIKTTANHPYLVRKRIMDGGWWIMDGRGAQSTIHYPQSTIQQWLKVSKLKVGDEVAVAKDNTRLSFYGDSRFSFFTDADFVFGDNGEPSAKNFRFISTKEREDSRRAIFNSWGFDFYKDDSGVRANGKMEDIAKVSIQCKKAAVFFDAKLDNLFVRNPTEASFQNSINFVTLSPEHFYCSNEETFVSKKFHLNNFLNEDIFVFNNPYSIMDSSLDIFTRQLRIAICENALCGISGSNKFQNHINSDTRPLNAGFAKADIRVNRNSILERIISHYFHLQLQLYHKLIEVSSIFQTNAAYAQTVLETGIFWDKIVSI